MNFRAAFLFFCVILLYIPLSMAQDRDRSHEQPPRFEGGVNFVQVDVVVTDKEGNRITDLGPEDFEVFEADEAQEVASFRVVEIPVEQDVARPVSMETDVRINRLPEEGRLYILVLDSLHTSLERTGRVRRIAREFVEKWIGPGDLAAVVATRGGQATQPFTNNRALLIEAIDKFQGDRLPSPIVTLAQAQREGEERKNPFFDDPAANRAEPSDREAIPDKYDNERAFRARSMLQTLRGAAELLGSVEGRRKAILFIGEGIDYDLFGLAAYKRPLAGDFMARGPIGPAILAEIRRTIGEVARSNAAIYCLDPSGLDSGAQGVVRAGTGPLNPSTLYAERDQRQDNLQELAGETGGVAILNQNKYVEGLQTIVEDTGRYYLLGYYPTNQKQDGEYREIRVTVKRPDLKVRARKGYVAGSPERAEETETAGEEDLFNAMEISEIPLRVSAGALELRGRNAMVPIVVEIGINGFQFTEEEETLRDRIELTAVALDRQGQAVASQGRMLDISVSSRVRDLMVRHGFRAVTRLDLSPGEYQLRVIVREEGAGRKGTVFLDLEVPDCPGKNLALGGVFIGSLRQTFIPVHIEREEKGEFVFPPSTRRSFAADDELLVQTEVCFGGEAVVVETDVRMAQGDLVFRDVRSHENGNRTTHRVPVPLGDLEPGSYVLLLTARDPAGGAEAVRKIAFEVMP